LVKLQATNSLSTATQLHLLLPLLLNRTHPFCLFAVVFESSRRCRYMDDDDEKFWDAVDSLDDVAAAAAVAEPQKLHAYVRMQVQTEANA